MPEAAHETHPGHTHRHGPGCGHTAIRHGDHTDYLHDGHLHHPHEDHVDEHVIEPSDRNPVQCTPAHRCTDDGSGHVHGPSCGHEAVPHGDTSTTSSTATYGPVTIV
jgi:hypothetical protein